MEENKAQILEHCWEIIRATEKFDHEKDCVDDLIGDIQSQTSDILFYLLKIMDYKDIGAITRSSHDNI